MPAKSAKQQRFMGMCAHMKNAPKVCPPKKIAREFAKKPAKGYPKTEDRRNVKYY